MVRGGWLPGGTCRVTWDDHVCCRYAGHPGDHEEWLDRDGALIIPIRGDLSVAWPAAPSGDDLPEVP